MTVIQTDGLTKRYGKQLAVDEISFSVESGQVFGFLGPNGSGKTTTIGMLLGIITPTGGSVRLFGEYGRAQLHRARQRIGATLEYPNSWCSTNPPTASIPRGCGRSASRRFRVPGHHQRLDRQRHRGRRVGG